jgi:hypothetical protein
MQVSEVLDFDTYFVDDRFEYKKPHPGSDWRVRCGDNIYHREDSAWRQEWFPFHNQPWQLLQDTRHPRVFVAEEYFYFGENA